MDMTSYLLGNVVGKKEGEKHVILESSDYEFTDTDNGNIVIEKEE